MQNQIKFIEISSFQFLFCCCKKNMDNVYEYNLKRGGGGVYV